jgi:DNA polymerase-4
VFLEADSFAYRDAWDGVLDALASISPVVADAALGEAHFDTTGLPVHYGSEQGLGHEALKVVEECCGNLGSLGIAAGKFLSSAGAAMSNPGDVTVIPAGLEAEFLAPLPITLLPVDAQTLERLRLLGFDLIGDIAAIPLGDLNEQFGGQGKHLWELCNGIDENPLIPRRREELLEEHIQLETAVAGIEVLIACARQLLSRLQNPLRGRAVREVVLWAELEGGRSWEKRLVLREAVSESDRLAFVLKSTLNAYPPPAPVMSMTLRLANLSGETGKQLGFDERSRVRSQTEEAIRQLTVRYGSSPIFQCVDAEPWSPIPEDRRVLVEYDA